MVIDAFSDKTIFVEEEVSPKMPKGVQPGITQPAPGYLEGEVQSIAADTPEETFELCTHQCPDCGLVWDHDGTVQCPGEVVSKCPDCQEVTDGESLSDQTVEA